MTDSITNTSPQAGGQPIINLDRATSSWANRRAAMWTGNVFSVFRAAAALIYLPFVALGALCSSRVTRNEVQSCAKEVALGILGIVPGSQLIFIRKNHRDTEGFYKKTISQMTYGQMVDNRNSLLAKIDAHAKNENEPALTEKEREFLILLNNREQDIKDKANSYNSYDQLELAFNNVDKTSEDYKLICRVREFVDKSIETIICDLRKKGVDTDLIKENLNRHQGGSDSYITNSAYEIYYKELLVKAGFAIGTPHELTNKTFDILDKSDVKKSDKIELRVLFNALMTPLNIKSEDLSNKNLSEYQKLLSHKYKEYFKTYLKDLFLHDIVEMITVSEEDRSRCDDLILEAVKESYDQILSTYATPEQQIPRKDLEDLSLALEKDLSQVEYDYIVKLSENIALSYKYEDIENYILYSRQNSEEEELLLDAYQRAYKMQVRKSWNMECLNAQEILRVIKETQEDINKNIKKSTNTLFLEALVDQIPAILKYYSQHSDINSDIPEEVLEVLQNMPGETAVSIERQWMESVCNTVLAEIAKADDILLKQKTLDETILDSEQLLAQLDKDDSDVSIGKIGVLLRYLKIFYLKKLKTSDVDLTLEKVLQFLNKKEDLLSSEDLFLDVVKQELPFIYEYYAKNDSNISSKSLKALCQLTGDKYILIAMRIANKSPLVQSTLDYDSSDTDEE